MHKDFNPEHTFERFKKVKTVKVNDQILKVKISDDCVVLLSTQNYPQTAIHKYNLYARWLLIDGVLHYIQKINHWMGSSACKYVKAEIEA